MALQKWSTQAGNPPGPLISLRYHIFSHLIQNSTWVLILKGEYLPTLAATSVSNTDRGGVISVILQQAG
jgi:hypothetical protein